MPVELGSQEFWDRLTQHPAKLGAEVCMVDVVHLDRTLETHPALRAWVNATYEVARIQVERAEWEVTKARAIKLLDVKAQEDAAKVGGGKGKTVDLMKAEVEVSSTVQAAMEALLDAQEKCGALKAMANALEDRKDMLVQIAAKHRKEYDDYNH